MIKYTCNAFHAVKIGFANEIGALCGTMGVSPDEVMDTVCRDFRLNISPAYLKPGFAFGGSCLPKDLRALTYRAARLDLRLPMLQSVLPSNEEHLRRACERVLDQQGNLGVFGLAFKENTDDVRESPTIAMIEFLIGKGRNVRIFDPHIQLESIYGSNRSFLLSAIPHIGKLMAPDLAWMLRWADTVVVAQKPSPLFRSALEHSGLPTVDLVGTGIGAGALAMSAAAH
jgi:GDP-mannose 6-dehydrogenase